MLTVTRQGIACDRQKGHTLGCRTQWRFSVRECVFMQDLGEGTYLYIAHIGDEHVS
jgi:hypothetical protein